MKTENKMTKYDIISMICFVLFLILLPFSVTNFKNWLMEKKAETAAETETAKQKQPKRAKTEFILFHYQQLEEYE